MKHRNCICIHVHVPQFRGHLRNCHHLSLARLSIRKLGMSSIDSADKADSETHEIGRSTGTGGGHSDGGGGGGGEQPPSKNKRKRPRGVAEVGPVQLVDGYEKVMLEDGGFKRRRVGAKRWQRICHHSRRRYQCKKCGGASICEHGRQRNKCKECGGQIKSMDCRTGGEER